MRRSDLERHVAGELSRLPLPRAPQTLLPRVMASVQQWARRPWYTREWLAWPVGWQVASLAVFLLLLAGGAMLLPRAEEAAGALAASMPGFGVPDELVRLADTVAIAVSLARTIWRALLEPLATYAFVLVLLLCIACVVFGTALSRVAMGRAVPL